MKYKVGHYYIDDRVEGDIIRIDKMGLNCVQTREIYNPHHQQNEGKFIKEYKRDGLDFIKKYYKRELTEDEVMALLI